MKKKPILFTLNISRTIYNDICSLHGEPIVTTSLIWKSVENGLFDTYNTTKNGNIYCFQNKIFTYKLYKHILTIFIDNNTVIFYWNQNKKIFIEENKKNPDTISLKGNTVFYHSHSIPGWLPYTPDGMIGFGNIMYTIHKYINTLYIHKKKKCLIQ